MQANHLKHWHRRLAAIAGAVLLLGTLGTGGCAYFKDWRHLPASKADETTIYVTNHGWHTGIVIAREELGESLTFVPQQLGDYALYEFGWGEKDFYQAPDNTVWLALKALLWVNDTTMHVSALPTTPDQYFTHSETVALHISRDALRDLTSAISASFAKNAEGRSLSTRSGLYGVRSAFFDGTGRYYLTNTCNTWTARMLDIAGVPTTTVLTLSAGSVMRQSKRAAEKYRCCAP